MNRIYFWLLRVADEVYCFEWAVVKEFWTFKKFDLWLVIINLFENI